ncbi:MAG TPA: DHA2 family efflux MFS transporter permease subunit [Thermoleophilia bacterium]|nr:DHA2 family efflux MFS transporter permease subunit [Thermoleophilia bacterium]
MNASVMAAGRRRWWALGALALSSLVVGLDLTVLNLALPTLAVSLHITNGGVLQWFVVSYSLVFAAMLLPGGLLGDRYGRKRLLIVALVVFGLASLACAYAGSAGQLIAARAFLGLGAAFILPLSVAVIPVLFSEDERQRAITVVMGMTMIAFPIGPILGGWLLTHFWWGSVFLINVPVIAVALVAVALLMPESRSARRSRIDYVGVLLSSAGLTALSYGLIEAGQRGWGQTMDILYMVAGGLVLVAFVAWERVVSRRRSGRPLVDLTLFASRGFTWGTILATMVSFAMFGLLFTVPTYYQAIVGVDPLGAGVRLLPLVGGLVLGAVLSDRMAAPIGAKLTVAWGFVLIAAGLLVGALTSVGSGYGYAALWVTIMGAGLGFALPGAMNAALGALSAERSGVGSALIMALRQVGGTFGVAILGSILSGAYRSGLRDAVVPAALSATVRDSVAEGVAVAHQIGSAALFAMVRGAFVHGMDVMLAVCGGIAVAGIVLTLVFLPRRSEPAEAADSPDAVARASGSGGVARTGGQGAESAQPAASGK